MEDNGYTMDDVADGIAIFDKDIEFTELSVIEEGLTVWTDDGLKIYKNGAWENHSE